MQGLYARLENVNQSGDMYWMATNLTEQQMNDDKVKELYSNRYYIIELGQDNEPVSLKIVDNN